MLVQLAPVHAVHREDAVPSRAVELRRRRGRTRRLAVALAALSAVVGAVVAVLVGAVPRGDAAVLAGAATIPGLAAVLVRRVRGRAGAGGSAGPVPVGAGAPAGDVDAPAPAGPGTAVVVADDAVPVFDQVWSARGRVRPACRRSPVTRRALPPAGDARATSPEGPASANRADEVDGIDEIDLTREVLAALHVGPVDERV